MTDLRCYAEFAPTCLDPKGLGLPDRQGWCLAPVGQNRDSGPLKRSNYAVALRVFEEIDPDGEDHEEHRFGHWGPGWFEIILVRPDSECYREACDMAAALSDYPVLDEMHLSELEYEEACDAWEYLDMRERIAICARHKVSIFAARRNEIPNGLPYFDDFYSPSY